MLWTLLTLCGYLIAINQAQCLHHEVDPTGNYQAKVYRFPDWAYGNLGGGDTPGFAVLRDTNGDFVAWVYLEMVLQGQINWFQGNVEIGHETINLQK